MANIGTAYINIAPNMSGIQSKITAGLAGTGSVISKQFEQETSGIGKVFNGVMSGVSAAVQGTAVIIGGVLATSLSGAISRVDTLNNASRVFHDMGFSADQVTSSTDNLKKSILGLPTALNSAISNVQLLASSTGNLDVAQKLFSALNDGILGFGGSTEMVSNATLQLGQALSNGKIDAATWNSLLNSQLGPALNAIAKQMGITTGTLKDGLSSGKISVDDFEKSLINLDQNGGGGLVSLRQLAQESTQGIGTSIENLKTAVTRGMAGIVQAIGAPQIAANITAIGTFIENLEGKISGFISNFKASGGTLASSLTPILPVLGLLAGSLGPLISQIPVIGSLFSSITGPMGLVIGLIGSLIAASPDLQSAIGTAFGILADTLKQLAPTISLVGKIFAQFAGTLGNALAPVLVVLAQAFSQILTAIAPIIPPLLQLAVAIIQQILLPILPSVVTLITMLATVFTQVMAAIMPLMPQITSLVMLLITALAPILPQLTALFLQLITAVLPLLPPLLQLVTIILPPMISLITVLANLFATYLVAALTITMGIISDVITVFGHFINELADVYNFADTLLIHIKAAFSGIKDAAGDMVGKVVSWFQSLPGTILKAVGGMGSTLYNAGAQTIQGFLNGAESLLKTVGKFFIDKLPSWIQGPFKAAMGIHSPSKVFAGYGQNITQGLANGIGATQSVVTSAVNDLADSTLANMGTPEIKASVASNLSGSNVVTPSSGAAPASNTTEVNVQNLYCTTADAVKQVFHELNQDTINVGMGLTPNQGALIAQGAF